MMRLLDRQVLFTQNVARLIDQAFALGYRVTLGDAYRDMRCPYGAANSQHRRRLAIDLNLFSGDKYLTRTEDHRELGEWWESIGGIWGGRFEDGNHYQAPPDRWIPHRQGERIDDTPT